MSVPSERWRRIDALCQAALELPPADRDAFLAHTCDDPEEREEARGLLAHAADAEHFLERPVAEAASALPPIGARLTGTRIGIFDIGPLLGSGGMGDVYRARDTRLNRDVALKILPLTFALEPDRLDRFRVEAHALASLNHPNIAAIYGAEESNGVYALVLELVEGQTLAERLAEGPIPLVDVVLIAAQIADALESAHEQGIVHNDVKPQNVKLTTEGRVKMLDFGLATMMRIASDGGGPHAPSTNAEPAFFGTRAYASPEQWTGRGDKRSDIWAFGAVLFEMLCGRPAFGEQGETGPRATPHWGDLPLSTPPALRHLVARCLEPNVRRRLRDIGEARIALDDLAAKASNEGTGSVQGDGDSRRWPASWTAPALVIAVLLATVFATNWVIRILTSRPSSTDVVRLSITLPQDESLSTGDRSVAAISPDGRTIVYAAAPAGLYLRPLAAPQSAPIAGVEEQGNVGEPVFSPDGRWILFHALGDRTLKRIPASGGAAITICAAMFPYGVSWTNDGIVFVEPGRGILRVEPGGGQPRVLVPLGPDRAAQSPQLLAGGERLLYTLASGLSPDRWDRGRIIVRNLVSGEETTVLEGGSDARYVAPDRLIYAVGGNLFAVPFNPRAMKVEGAAVSIVQGVRRGASALTGTAQFGVGGGTLMYLAGAPSAKWGLGLIDRKGMTERLPLPSDAYEAPRVSPDGRRIAFGTDNGKEAVVWIYDLSGTAPARRLTFGGNARFPMWSGDGRVAFQFDRDGEAAIYWQSLDGGPAERLTMVGAGEVHEPEAWSPARKELIYSSTNGGDVTLWTLALQTRTASRFGDVHSSTRTGAVLSPDGRWLAYARSDATGKTIYVEPYPATGTKHQLAIPGIRQPNHPLWSPDGRELFYNPGPGRFEVVPIVTGPRFAFGNPVALRRFFPGASTQTRRPFDVLPDGRFVAPIEAGMGDVHSQEIRVFLNWANELAGATQP